MSLGFAYPAAAQYDVVVEIEDTDGHKRLRSVGHGYQSREVGEDRIRLRIEAYPPCGELIVVPKR